MAEAAEVIRIPAGKLKKTQGDPKVGSVRSPHREGVADSLTPQRLASIMRAADLGETTAYLTLAQEMEERDCHYRSVLHTRKMAVSGIAPALELPGDAEVPQEVVDAVEKRLLETPAFEALVYDLLDGLGKGFSCVEILWAHEEEEWYPTGYVHREQRHFVFDLDTLSRPLLRTDEIVAGVDGEQGEPLRPYQWIVHIPKLASGIPIRAGLARTAAVAYAAKRWTAADWMAFLDVYGVPIRLGKYPASMADKKHLLLKAVRAIGSDAAAVVPQEMEIELIESKGAGATSVFRETVEYWDKQVSKVVLGQTMTSDDGASLSQSKTHEQVRFDIRDADCRSVCATLDEQLVKPFVDLNFGPQEHYPKVRLFQRKPEDLVPLMQAVKTFVDLGGDLQKSEVRDRLGFAEPEEGEELLEPKPPPVAPGLPGQEPPPGQPPKGKGSKAPAADGEPAEEDDEVEEKPSRKARELNARRKVPTYDAVDEVLAEELSQWRRLEDPNVGRLIKAIQDAATYDEARELLAELARDEGDVLDIGAVVVSLARSCYKLRGVGDATDERDP